ncbi:MAG: D-aminoacyl-tRNA deacylase [Candidatus Helarchaeota archaeon]
MPVIIVSKQDLAGLTIQNQLLALGDFKRTNEKFEGNPIFKEKETGVPLLMTNRRLIDSDHLNTFETDLIIFASKHKSESERPSLLVHAPGNWTDDASYGGNPRELGRTSAKVIKWVLNNLTIKQQKCKLEYDVTSEVTHHGPTNLKAPCVFIELGSNLTYWQDPEGAKIVAETILQLISNPFSDKPLKYAIGFGGPHYATNFNKVQLHSEFAISHIAAKYVLDVVTEDLVIQAIEKTRESVKYAVFDWKGMNKTQKDKIVSIIDRIGLPILRTNKIIN